MISQNCPCVTAFKSEQEWTWRHCAGHRGNDRLVEMNMIPNGTVMLGEPNEASAGLSGWG